MSHYPLPGGFQDLLGNQPLGIEHPGLLLDRYVSYPNLSFDSFDQKTGQQDHLRKVIETSASFARRNKKRADDILAEWEALLDALPLAANRWTQKTLWRLTLHLARASALENAGLCLHPLYGFAYLPETGLKGLARAHAELTSLAANPKTDPKKDKTILRILGSTDAAGTVEFFASWPSEWPALEKDIVNNHHQEYYRHEGVGHPPGDWEKPNLTYFLAVAPDTEFRFAIAHSNPAPSEADRKDLATACTWLKEALREMGAGAKTAAGYGYFDAPEP